MYLSNYKIIRSNKITILHFVEFLLCVCMSVCTCACVCTHTHMTMTVLGAHCGQWRTSEPMELELQIIVSAGNQSWVILDEKQALFTSALSF